MKSLFQKLILCLALILCLVYYAKTHFYRDPGSPFFDPTRAYERRYSTRREAQVKQYIEAQRSANTTTYRNGDGSQATLCVVLNSVHRDHAEYLETTIGSLLEGLRAEERQSLHIAVLIAEPVPEVHSAWTIEWLRRAVDDLFTYDVDSEGLERLDNLKQHGNFAEKGVYDYTYALQRCHDTGTPYIGVFEDDILMADGWLVRALLELGNLPSAGSGGDEWLLMRLFNQERSTGWASRQIGGNHEFWIILAMGLVVGCLAFLMHRQWRFTREYLNLEIVAVLTLFLIPALVVLFFQCGKASLLPPRAGVANEPFGRCSQAMIFPHDAIPGLQDFLRRKKAGQVDLLLNEYSQDAGLARLALYPVQAQHIGLESARKPTVEEAQAVWSMAFEDLREDQLTRDHHRMFDEYYRGH